MKLHAHTIPVLLLLVATLAGCSTMKTTWRDTRKLYKEYVVVEPSIDYSNEGLEDKSVQKLAALFSPVDERLDAFMRIFTSQDIPPEPAMAAELLVAYPWVSGVAELGTDGVVRGQLPAVSLRPLDFAPLMAFEDRYKVRKPAALVSTDEMGTVVFLAMPFFENNEWSGLIVAWFDPRSLLQFSPSPNELFIVSTVGPVWLGEGEGAGGGGGLAGVKWADILRNEVQGAISAGGTYVWVARRLGQMSLIYACDARVPDKKKDKAAPPAQPGDPAAPPVEGSSTPPVAGQPVAPPPGQ